MTRFCVFSSRAHIFLFPQSIWTLRLRRCHKIPHKVNAKQNKLNVFALKIISQHQITINCNVSKWKIKGSFKKCLFFISRSPYRTSLTLYTGNLGNIWWSVSTSTVLLITSLSLIDILIPGSASEMWWFC